MVHRAFSFRRHRLGKLEVESVFLTDSTHSANEYLGVQIGCHKDNEYTLLLRVLAGMGSSVTASPAVMLLGQESDLTGRLGFPNFQVIQNAHISPRQICLT